ncbi:MAG: hypothetical protein JXR37_32085 [Kiritimatiellae bacterium]|nr:hypothetical protein [Kiritimatiellia bacterium]
MKVLPDYMRPRHWALNAIMVKELRQFVRSRFMVSLFMFFLLVLVIGTGGFVISHSIERLVSPMATGRWGRQLFMILLGILNAACMLFVPAYVGTRFAVERSALHTDLLFVTTLTPGAIIRGKLYSGLIMALVIFSACMPFMVFTYLLRGIDLPSIFVILSLVLLAIAVCIQSSILVAAVPATRVFKSLLGLGLAVGLCQAIGLMTLAGYTLLEEGVGSMLAQAQFWGVAATVVVLGLGAIWLQQVFAAALIMPPSANRALSVRLNLTAAWLIGGLITGIWAAAVSEAEILLFWLVPSMVVWSFALGMVVSERDQLSRRIRSAIPRRRLLRPVAFFFYTGPAGGLMWSFTMAGFTLFLAFVLAAQIGGWRGYEEALEVLAILWLYMFCYALTASIVRRLLLRSAVSHGKTWVIMLLLIMVGTLLPVFTGFVRDTLSPHNKGTWRLGNIFTLGDESFRPVHMVFALSWAAAAVALSAPWLWRQIGAFKPLESTATPARPETDPAAPPPAAQQPPDVPQAEPRPAEEPPPLPDIAASDHAGGEGASDA